MQISSKVIYSEKKKGQIFSILSNTAAHLYPLKLLNVMNGYGTDTKIIAIRVSSYLTSWNGLTDLGSKEERVNTSGVKLGFYELAYSLE